MKYRYPRDHAFDGDSLFDIITSLTHPDIKDFLIDHLVKNKPLPIADLFDKIGIEYKAFETHPAVKSGFGFIVLPVKTSGRLFIYGIYEEARDFGFEVGDTLISFNGEKITISNMGLLLRSYFFKGPGKSYTMVVKKDGKYKTIKAKSVIYYTRHLFNRKRYPDPEEKRLRTAWLTK
jgi:hypothetical protein